MRLCAQGGRHQSLWGDQITQISFSDFAYDRPGLHVERAEMDDVLLRHAPSRVGFGACMRVIRAGHMQSTDIAGGATVAVTCENERGQIACRCTIIDATGQASLLMARQLNLYVGGPIRNIASLRCGGYFRDSRYVDQEWGSRGRLRIWHRMRR